MHKKEAYELCKKHVNQFVMIHTKDGQTMHAIIENVDEENVYLAMPVPGVAQTGSYRYPYTSTGVYPGYGYGYGVPGYTGTGALPGTVGGYGYPGGYVPGLQGYPGYPGYGYQPGQYGGFPGGYGGYGYPGGYGPTGYGTTGQTRYPFGFGFGYGYPFGFGYPWYFRRFGYPLGGIAGLSLLPFFI
ncbi:hypothetical protein [Marinicrinis lubricantis]|uniref:Spore coat protein n=1 Tax=Marinicrinis lubricantis TaxID=2086470 RepID=A0ABW1IUR2_9BACL